MVRDTPGRQHSIRCTWLLVYLS